MLGAGECVSHGGWGVGSSIVKVPGDVPSARVYFFVLLVWPVVYFLQNFSPFGLGKGMLFGNFGRRRAKFW